MDESVTDFEDNIVTKKIKLSSTSRVSSNSEHKRNRNDSMRQYSRHSFDRFGDDLCEVILSFLSFTDKIRFEEVCKQWKRCVYNKQTLLRVFAMQQIEATQNMSSVYLNALLEPITVTNYVSGYARNMNMQILNKCALNCLLRKCKFIKKIEFTRCFVDTEILEIIGTFCAYLESFKFDIIGLDQKDIERFGENYGKRFKHICVNMTGLFARDYSNKFCNDFGKKLIAFCSNIESFMCEDISIITDSNPGFLPKLENLDLKIRRNDLNNFTHLADKYWDRMKKLKLYSHEIDQPNLRNILQQISRFHNIEDLNLNFSLFTQNNTTINDKVVELSKNCPKLTRLVFTVNTTFTGNELISGNIFDCFGKFTALKCLKISLQVKEVKETVECFKKCPHLLHLTIRCTKIGDAFFKDIDVYLPNIKSLNITTEHDLTDDVMHSLAKLTKLSKVALGSNNRALKFITDSGVCNLINSCPHIRDIVFFSRPNITTLTIDELIKLAERKPKTNFRFYCGFSRLGDEASFAQIDMNNYQSLSSNLRINIITGAHAGNPWIPQNAGLLANQPIQLFHHPNIHVINVNPNVNLQPINVGLMQVNGNPVMPPLPPMPGPMPGPIQLQAQPIQLQAPVQANIDVQAEVQVGIQGNPFPIQAQAQMQNLPLQVQQHLQHILGMVQAHHGIGQNIINNPF